MAPARKSLLHVLIGLLICYALLVLGVTLIQRRLIYFPTRMSKPVALMRAAKEGFQPWRDNSGKLIGWNIPAKSPARGAVLIIHGNAGCALDRDYLAQPIRNAAALDIFILEYPGYGSSDGKPSLKSFNTAGEAAVRAMPANLPVYVVSESLGTGVAAHLAKTFSSRIAGMAMFVPYDKLTSVAQHQMRFLPAALMLRDRFAPGEWLKDYRGPIVFVVAENDTIIPPKYGKRLHDGYAGPKKLRVIEGAGHNDVSAQPEAMWGEIMAFWNENATTTR